MSKIRQSSISKTQYSIYYWILHGSASKHVPWSDKGEICRALAPQVGSHYHFIETNRALKFDRAVSLGYRLNVPAGASVRFEPGEAKTVTLTQIAGARDWCADD
eukprot:6193457-Pleurochrysis_carterae.AAC.2